MAYNTMRDRIDHAAEARKYTEKALHPSTGSPEVGLVYAQLANTEATLALVEQQRISNLIALEDRWGGEARDAFMAVERDEAGFKSGYHLNPDVASALGIEKEEDDAKEI